MLGSYSMMGAVGLVAALTVTGLVKFVQDWAAVCHRTAKRGNRILTNAHTS